MLVATFGPTTGWVGKTIDYEGGQFALQGHGLITAADVLNYDQQGQITWAYPGLQEWVQQVAASSSAAPAVVPPLAASQPVVPPTSPQPARPSRGVPAWGVALIAVGVIAVVMVVVVVAVAFATKANQDDLARQAAVKEGLHSLQIGVQSYAVDHNDAYPPAGDLSLVLGTTYVENWPANPYNGLPMAQGTSEGDYSYSAGADGKSFTLIGYGKDGKVVITLTSP